MATNKGVEILLARMESNPEEFSPTYNPRDPADYDYSSKWRNIIHAVYDRANNKGGNPPHFQLRHLSDEDFNLLKDKLDQLHGVVFTQDVMRTLLSENPVDKSYDSSDKRHVNLHQNILQSLYKHGGNK